MCALEGTGPFVHRDWWAVAGAEAPRDTFSPQTWQQPQPWAEPQRTEPRLAARALQGSGTRGRGAAAGIRPSGSAPPLCRRLPLTGASSVEQAASSPQLPEMRSTASCGRSWREIDRARGAQVAEKQPLRASAATLGAQVLTARQASGPSGESRSLALGGHHPRVGLGRSAGSSRLRPVRARSFPAGEKPEPFPPGT